MHRTPGPSDERRRDRRHALTGFGRLVPFEGGYEWYGGIVDVSARGVRLRVRPGADIPDDLRCHVLLEVSLPAANPGTPPVRLDGDAVLLRRSFAAGDRIEEIALRFDRPLRVGDAFASVVPAARAKTPQPA
ncbi:MAG: hypothetical protein U1E39_17060 [Planctomycetota bacterium]